MKNLLKKLVTMLTLCTMLSVLIVTPIIPGNAIPSSDEEIIIIKDKQK